MLSAGVILLVLGVASGELWSMEPSRFSLQSVLAWLYLGIFGTLVAFTAYTWLLRNAPISKVVTRQYVNPIVAIALGRPARRGDHACRRRRRRDRRDSVFVAVRSENAAAGGAVHQELAEIRAAPADPDRLKIAS